MDPLTPADQAQDLTADAGSRDPAVGLRSVRALRTLTERLEELQVNNARAQGWSWQEIADQLGVSKQAVHQKFAGGRRLGRRG
jgi:DNA-binding NarL/FixJ family response regulator